MKHSHVSHLVSAKILADDDEAKYQEIKAKMNVNAQCEYQQVMLTVPVVTRISSNHDPP